MTGEVTPAGRRTNDSDRPRGGRRLTSILCFLAAIAIGNALLGGARILYAGNPQLHSLRLLIDVAASVLLSGWALARVKKEWADDAGAWSRESSRAWRSAPGETNIGLRTDRDDPGAPARTPRRSSWLRYARGILILGLCATAAITIASEWGTLESAFERLGDLRWGALRWAIYAEALAMIAFAQLTRQLLRAGGVNLRLGSMVGLTLASNAVALTLPGGPVWAVTFSFDQLRRRGVHRALSTYAIGGTWLLSAAALVVITLVGIELAGGSGPAAPFRLVASVAGALLAVVAIAAVLAVRSPRIRGVIACRVQRLGAKGRFSRIGRAARASGSRIAEIHPPPRLLWRSMVAAVLNWIFDCTCLVGSILAVGGHVPWQGVLAAYAITQLAAALPITPGGIGVVEGTLSVLLIAYHIPAATAIAAVMLYRIISFWFLVPVGWATLGVLVAAQRRGRPKATWVPSVPPARRARVTAT